MSLPIALIAGLSTAVSTAAAVEQNRAQRSAQRSMNETQVREQTKQDEERRRAANTLRQASEGASARQAASRFALRLFDNDPGAGSGGPPTLGV